MDEKIAQAGSILTLRILSFSYRTGIPQDKTGHGGGFVFDCRCLPNPGREERFCVKSGRDDDVKSYLEASLEVEAFYAAASALVRQAVGNYREREFDHLMVAFGCTGGQHRSVYLAERLAEELREIQGVSVFLCHEECGRWEGLSKAVSP